MWIFLRKAMRCTRGTLLIDALVAAVLVGIVSVALLAAFGRSSDIGDASAEYIMANALAQKQLELLKDNTTTRSDGVICNKAYWDARLPAYQATPPALGNAYYNLTTVPVQMESSPATCIGSNSQFSISNQARWAYDATLTSGNGNIDIISTVTWTTNARTGTQKARTTTLSTQIRYPTNN